MTAGELHRLPALISRKQFREVTGVSDRVLSDLVAAGAVRQWKRELSEEKKAGRVRGVYARYYTADAMRICGLASAGEGQGGKGRV